MSNVTLNAGSGGATLGTDQVAGTPNIDYQIVKIGYSVTTAAPTQVSTTNPLPVTLANTGANATAIKVDNSAVTQPVSGTVTTSPPANASTNLTQVVGTAIDVNSGVKSAGTMRVVIATDQPALTNKLLVTPDSVALPANQSVNVSQVSGTTADTNSGVKSAGTLRVVLATDQPALTNKLLVTPDSVALPANQSVNVSQINGVTPLMGNGTTGTGSQRVTIASDNSAFSVNAAQSGTRTVQPGNTANSTPWLVTDTPGTSGGLSFSYVLSAASNNLTQAKGSAGQLFTVVVTNTNAAARYLKLFNKASASVTMGTTVADFQFVIPGNTAGAGIAINIDKGIALGTGISYAITAGVALNDNTSVAANEVSALIGYK